MNRQLFLINTLEHLKCYTLNITKGKYHDTIKCLNCLLLNLVVKYTL